MSSNRSRYVDINGLAEYLGVTVRHIRRLVAEDRIPYIKWGLNLHEVRRAGRRCWSIQASISSRS